MTAASKQAPGASGAGSGPRPSTRKHRAWRGLARRIALLGLYGLAALGVVSLQPVVVAGAAHGEPLAWLLLAAMLAAEVWTTLWHEGRGRAPWRAAPGPVRRWVAGMAFVGRLGVWTLLWWMFLVLPNIPVEADHLRRTVLVETLRCLGIVVSLAPLVAAGLAVAWLAVFELLVARWRVLRGLVMMALPILMTWAVVYLHYLGYVPRPTARELAEQPGVEVLFDAAAVEDPALRGMWTFPRQIAVDEARDAIFVGFGRSFGSGVSQQDAGIWRIRLSDGSSDVLRTPSMIRAFSTTPDSPLLYAASWLDPFVPVIDKRSFEVVEWLPIRARGRTPIEVPYLYRTEDALLFGLAGWPELRKLDPATGRELASLSLVEIGLNDSGGACCYVVPIPGSTDLMMLSAGMARSFIIRLDPATLAVRQSRVLPAPPFMITYTGGPSAELYGIAEYSGELWHIDSRTLEVTTVGDGFGFESRLFFDPWRDRLVVVDYARGEVVVLRPDATEVRRFRTGHKSYWAEVTPRGVYVVSSAGVLRIAPDALLED